jgi:hypothetical protein
MMDMDDPGAMYRQQRAPAKKGEAVGSFPTPAEMRGWQLPVGSIIAAADATVTYPDGNVVTWGELRRQRRREAA